MQMTLSVMFSELCYCERCLGVVWPGRAFHLPDLGINTVRKSAALKCSVR